MLGLWRGPASSPELRSAQPLQMWELIRNQIDPTIAAVSSMLIVLPLVWVVVLEARAGVASGADQRLHGARPRVGNPRVSSRRAV